MCLRIYGSYVFVILICLSSPFFITQQAQVYFCGASRYVGVFDTSHQASKAFSDFKKYLQPYKKRAQDGQYSKEELQNLIDQGRQHASEAVQEWITLGKPFVAPAAALAAPTKVGE